MDRKAGGGDYEGHRAASVNKAAQGHWKEEKGIPQQTAAEAGKTAVTVKKRLQSENNGAAGELEGARPASNGISRRQTA